MSVFEYEKKFSELVRLVPYVQADEVLKCKRFLSELQHRIIVHLSVVPHNRFGEGTQPVFPFPNSGDPSGTPTDSKKKTNLSFNLNIFKRESVERTHLCNYVFH